MDWFVSVSLFPSRLVQPIFHDYDRFKCSGVRSNFWRFTTRIFPRGLIHNRKRKRETKQKNETNSRHQLTVHWENLCRSFPFHVVNTFPFFLSSSCVCCTWSPFEALGLQKRDKERLAPYMTTTNHNSSTSIATFTPYPLTLVPSSPPNSN